MPGMTHITAVTLSSFYPNYTRFVKVAPLLSGEENDGPLADMPIMPPMSLFSRLIEDGPTGDRRAARIGSWFSKLRANYITTIPLRANLQQENY